MKESPKFWQQNLAKVIFFFFLYDVMEHSAANFSAHLEKRTTRTRKTKKSIPGYKSAHAKFLKVKNGGKIR